MDLNLPKFEGHPVESVALSCSGTITDEGLQPTRALRLGQVVVVVGVAEIVAVNHKANADGEVTRTHKLKFVEAQEVPVAQADALLDSLRSGTGGPGSGSPATAVDEDTDADGEDAA